MSKAFILLPTAYNPESGEYERAKVPAKMGWVGNEFIQGGHEGVVVSLSGKNPPYRTAFVEVSDGKLFVRGEGKTLDAAEIDAWYKWLAVCQEDLDNKLKNFE